MSDTIMKADGLAVEDNLERELAAERAARKQEQAIGLKWYEESTRQLLHSADLLKRAEQAEARLADACFHLKCAGRLLEAAAVNEDGADGDECLEQKRNIDAFLSSAAPPPILAELERLRAENRKLADTVIGWSRLVERDEQLRAIEALRGTHDCGCEVCSRTSTLCPATASSYALRIIELESELAALKAELADTVAEIKVLRTEIAVLQAEPDALKLKLGVAKTALTELTKPKGAFRKDPLEHARNIIEDSIKVATEALSQLNNADTKGQS